MKTEAMAVRATRRWRRAAAAAIALALPFTLAACMSSLGSEEEIITGAVTSAPAVVDPDATAAAISQYRKSRGLSAVTIDPTLMAVAAEHSRRMARAVKMAHVLPGEGNLPARLIRSGYDAAIAVENIAAGPKTLDQVMAAWKKSRGHNANLLKKGVTGMGIAVAHTAKGKYNDYWTLVLAVRDERPTAGGPDAGPLIAVPQQ